MPQDRSAAVERSYLLKGFGGFYTTVPLYRVYLRTNEYEGYADVGVVLEHSVQGVTLLLGNDLAK